GCGAGGELLAAVARGLAPGGPGELCPPGGEAERSPLIEAAPAPRVLAPGTVVGRYAIERLIGAGGLGVVYAATDPELGRQVALKLLRVGFDQERLVRAARALARGSPPNVGA